VTDRQTDRWTHDDSKYRASIASRDKNQSQAAHIYSKGEVEIGEKNDMLK